MLDKSVRKTILTQFLMAVISLLVGAASIAAVTRIADAGGPYQLSRGDEFEFAFFSGLFHYTSLVAIVFVTQYVSMGLSPSAPIRQSFRCTLFAAIIALGLHACIVLIMGLGSWHNLKLGLASLGISLVQFALTGFHVGISQSMVLVAIKFDDLEYSRLTSWRADLEACQSHRLPYRLTIEFFWKMVFLLLGALAGTVALVVWVSVVIKNYTQDAGALLVGSGICIIIVWGCFKRSLAYLRILRAHQPVSSVYGSIAMFTEKRLRRYGRTYIVNRVRCCGTEITVPDSSWYRLNAESRYYLWYYTLDEDVLITYEEIPQEGQEVRLYSGAASPIYGRAKTLSRDHSIEPTLHTHSTRSTTPRQSRSVANHRIGSWEWKVQDDLEIVGCAGRVLAGIILLFIIAGIIQGITEAGAKHCPGLLTALSIILVIAIMVWNWKDVHDSS